MPTKTIDKDAKIVAIPGTAGFKIGHTCPKCGCDDWFKAAPAMQKRAAAGKAIYGCRECANDKAKAQNAEYYKANADAINAQKAEYRKANVEAIKAQNADWKKANVDKVKAQNAKYRKANVDKVKVRIADWKKANSGKVNATGAKRRATKLNSTPHWLTKKDLAKIKKIYEDCPSEYQVDHILPLQGKHICGLHVPSNLKAIPASENASKCNREPDWTKKFQRGLHP